MKLAMFWAFIGTSCVVAFSIAVTWITLAWGGGVMDRTVLALCTAIPMVTAFPAMTYMFMLQNQLKRSYKHLQMVHSELQERSRIDPLTGILNRETFFNMMRSTRAGVDEGVLLVVDVDHFKQINDTFGHAVGDRALRHVAHTLQEFTHELGIVGRIGGEEFCLFIPHADELYGYQFARHLCFVVATTPFIISDKEAHTLTISIGGSVALKGETNSQVMRRADRCLYEAKAGGRNRAIFDEPISMMGLKTAKDMAQYAS